MRQMIATYYIKVNFGINCNLIGKYMSFFGMQNKILAHLLPISVEKFFDRFLSPIFSDLSPIFSGLSPIFLDLSPII